MKDNVLVFSNGKFFKSFPSADEMFPVTDIMRNKDEIFYLYVINSGYWYKHYSTCLEDDVPSIYKALKLMLTN